jgi:spermidine synthase
MPGISAATAKQTVWYYEYITDDLLQAASVKELMYQGETAYQRVHVLDTDTFGRMLVLDGKTQSSEADEFCYHEGLVQPIAIAHANPKRVFIAGGGEGATAREVLRHRSVEQVIMVDLDKEVVDLCKRYLPNHHQGAFDDPRLTLIHDDALVHLRDATEPFDLIIIDIPDPLEGGPAYLLYTEEFYAMVRDRLAPGGLMVAQSGPTGPTNVSEVFTAIAKTMDRSFPLVNGYSVYMPAFGCQWGFLVGVPEGSPDLRSISAEEVDARIDARLASPLRYYDGQAHHGMLGLPKYVRAAMAAEQRVITNDSPLFSV